MSGLHGHTSATSNPHPGNESNHYYRQTTAPVSVEAGGNDPLQIGDIWSDTTANLVKRCTGVNPDTFTSVEGGGGLSFAVPTGDVDIADAAVEGVAVTGVRSDHQHAFPAPGAGYPLDVAAAESDGAATTPSRSDHIHAHGTGYLPDAHHTQAHTIASHSDTTATGAELETLTDTSDADALHTHDLKANVSALHTQSHDHSAAGDGTTLTPAVLNVPSSTTPAQTAEGQAVWDSDDNLLTIGDAVGRQTFLPVIDATSDPLIDGSVADGTEDSVARKDHVHPFHHAQAHAPAHADGGADELAVQDLASDAATDGQVAKADGAGAVAFEDDEAGFSFIIDGGGSVIATGLHGDVEVPFACTITSVRLFADQSGAVVIDLWVDSYANFPPTVADTITASAKPTIAASGVKDEDTTLTSWTTALAKGDVIRYNVDSVATIERLTVSLGVDKT